jgi:hypothetical protein
VPSSGDYSKRVTNSTRAYERAHGDPVGAPCFHCGEPIPHRWRDSLADPEKFPYRLAFTVHHLDYDQANNAPGNLAPSHQHCNSGDRSPEGRERNRLARRASLVGREQSPETRAKKRAAWASPLLRENSRQIMRRNHAEGLMAVQYRCGDCDLVTRAGALASHQAHTDHRGRTRVGPTRDGRRRQSERGREGQAKHARRWETDPEYRTKVSTALSEAMTPERRAANAERMRELQRRRYECSGCGYRGTASNVTRHLNKTGHQGRQRVS